MSAHELRRADDRFLSAWDMPGWLIVLFVVAFFACCGVIGAALGKSLADYSDRLSTQQCEREAASAGTDISVCKE